MGTYVYQIKKASARKMVGGEIVHVAKFAARDCDSNEAFINRLHTFHFDDNPYFVEREMQAGSVVYAKTDRWNQYYDCADFGVEIGRLVQVGKRFKLVAIKSMDEVVRSCSCFKDFQALLDATGDHYSPSIYGDTWEKVALADAFDAAKKFRNESCRAYRGTGWNLQA